MGMNTWRQMIPRNTADRASVSVFTLGGVFLLWYEIFHIAPTYFLGLSLLFYIHCIWSLFLAFQIYANMFMIMVTDTSVGSQTWNQPAALVAPVTSLDICKKCFPNRRIPPRAHHCKICNLCLLKRDHHCYFSGCCIGLSNHRYYLVMVIYMVITAVYCNIFNHWFVWKVKGAVGILNLLTFIMPHVAWMMGLYDTYTFAITALTFMGFTLMVLFAWLLQIQVAQILHGQTKYEKKKDILRYDHGSWKRNIMDVLGENCYWTLLSPWIQSQLPGVD